MPGWWYEDPSHLEQFLPEFPDSDQQLPSNLIEGRRVHVGSHRHHRLLLTLRRHHLLLLSLVGGDGRGGRDLADLGVGRGDHLPVEDALADLHHLLRPSQDGLHILVGSSPVLQQQLLLYQSLLLRLQLGLSLVRQSDLGSHQYQFVLHSMDIYYKVQNFLNQNLPNIHKIVTSTLARSLLLDFLASFLASSSSGDGLYWFKSETVSTQTLLVAPLLLVTTEIQSLATVNFSEEDQINHLNQIFINSRLSARACLGHFSFY